MLAPYARWILPCVVVAAILPMNRRIGGQDKPKPGRAVTAWQVQRTSPFGNPGEVGESRDIYARNDTTVPIAVTVVRLSKCVNLRVLCDSVAINQLIIAPGGNRSVLRIVPALPAGAYSFSFTLGWRTATECIGVTANSPLDMAAPRATPAESDRLFLPPTDFPRNLHGTSVTVTFFVGASGEPDSTKVTGIADPRYLTKFQATMMKDQFKPATRNGCPIAAATSVTITL